MKRLTLTLASIILLIFISLNVSASELVETGNNYQIYQETNKIFTLVQYSGVQFVEEKGEWKRIDEVDDLKPFGFSCNIKEDSETKISNNKKSNCFNIKFIDGVGFSLDLNLSAKTTNATYKVIPIYVVRKEFNESNKKIETSKENVNGVTFLHTDWGQVHTIEGINIGDEIHVGKTSTVVTLDYNEVIADTWIYQALATTNFGQNIQINIRGNAGDKGNASISFNNSKLNSTTHRVLSADTWIYADGGGTPTLPILIFNSTSTTWWNESIPTWNNPSPISLVDKNVVNITAGWNNTAGLPNGFNSTAYFKSTTLANAQVTTMIFTINASDTIIRSSESSNLSTRPQSNVTIELINTAPILSNTNLNVTNATLFVTSENINASVTFTDVNSGDKANVTAILFINNAVNLTYQLLNSFANNTIVSIVFNHTNITAGQVVNVQFNATDGIDVSNYINTSKVTVNSTLSVAIPTFLTLNQTSSSPINIFQNNDFINVILTTLNPSSINATISVIDSSGNSQINNQSMTNNTANNFTYNTNFLYNQTGNWIVRIFANDGNGLIQNNLTINVSSPFRSFNAYYNNSISGGTHQQYVGNLSLDPTGLVGLNASLRYNNTIYNVNATALNLTGRQLLSNITTPIVIINTQKYFNYSINLDFGSGNYFQINTTTFAQNLTAIGLKACGIGDLLAYNFSLNQEANNTRLNGSFEATFFVYPYDIALNQTFTFNMTNLYSFPICLTDNSTSLKADAIINYQSPAYDPRQHYLTNNSLSNSTQNISLYLLDISQATGVTFIVTDELDSALANFIIRVERYEIGTNSYKTVGMGKSNDDGEYLIFLRLDDVFYRVSLEQNSSRLFQSQNTQLISSEYNIRLVSNAVSTLLDILDNIQILSPLTFNNGTKTFSVSYRDTSGRATQGCLYITRFGTGQVYNQCSTLNETTLSYSIGSQTGEFTANFYFKINPSKSLQTLSIVISSVSSPDFTDSRLFLTLILIIVLAGFGTALVKVAGFEAITSTLVGLILGVLIAKGMGLYDMSLPIITIICIGLAGMIIIIQKARK